MDISIDPIIISEIENNARLLHGFSSKYFKVEARDEEILRLGYSGDTTSSLEHFNGFLKSLNIKTGEVFLVRQTHSNKIYTLDDPSVTASQTASVEADAIITRLQGRAIGVLTADCIPIIAYDSRLPAVGIAHAGRKGTSKCILSKTITALKTHFGCKPQNIRVGMGPGIGVCCYEVDELCIQPFMEKYPDWKQFIKPSTGNKFMLDLFQANRDDSLSAGILSENIFLSGQCTSCENHRFFSYRKEGNTGRMMAVAMLNADST